MSRYDPKTEVASRQDADANLLAKLNAAVKAADEAQAEHLSRSKALGLLLLEARKLHPAVEDFAAFLKKVQGLGLSRAYDCMRIAGGRVTEEELRKDAADRQRKSRASRKLPKPTPALKKPDVPDSVTSRNPDTERAGQKEVPVEDRRAAMADLSLTPEQRAAKASAQALAEFTIACRAWLPKITVEADRQKARLLVSELTSGKPKAKAA